MILLRSIAAVTVVPLRRRGGCAELHGVRKKSKKMQEIPDRKASELTSRINFKAKNGKKCEKASKSALFAHF